MKLNQYCSVCKKHLDMDVISTEDGGDDGVIWLRCPECQGFLPKFTGADLGAPALDQSTAAEPTGTPASAVPEDALDDAELALPESDARAGDHDVPGEAPAAREVEVPSWEADAKPRVVEPAEPLAEYAAQLAAADLATASPYRPGQQYAVGDVIHHLAYDDIGVVVAKEDLPGGRTVAKTYFEKTGLVRLIELPAGKR